MNITVEQRGAKTLVHLQEQRVDAHNSGDLKERLQQWLEDGAKALVVDLSEVNFIDSSGLGALLSGYKNASLRQGSLVLCGLQPRVQSMFELTRLNRVFDIYANVDAALSAHEQGDSHEPDGH